MKPVAFFDGLVARFNAELALDASPQDVEYYNKMKIPTMRK